LSWLGVGLLLSVSGLFGLSLLLRHWDPLPLKFAPERDARFRVEVLNGSGRHGVASKVAEYLRDRGLDVVYVGNADSFEHERTLIIDRVGCPERATTVAGILGYGMVQSEADSLRLVEVTVILGADEILARGD
jgi:hypothetical protein